MAPARDSRFPSSPNPRCDLKLETSSCAWSGLGELLRAALSYPAINVQDGEVEPNCTTRGDRPRSRVCVRLAERPRRTARAAPTPERGGELLRGRLVTNLKLSRFGLERSSDVDIAAPRQKDDDRADPQARKEGEREAEASARREGHDR